MKTITLSLFMILAGCELRAQFYQITFAGTGASSTVDSVKVENLSQCTSLLLGGTDTLILDREVGIKETGNPREYTMNLYPNPCPGTCSVEFQVPSAGDISIRLYGISGETILHEKEFLQKGEHRFQLSGIEAGVYIVKIETDRHIYSAKLISKAAGAGSPAFTAMEPAVMKMMQPDVNGTTDPGQFRGTRSIVLMQFNAGDTLKLTGKSGNYRTVSMLFPTHNQTVTFSFVNCTDADSNHYAVVRIGSQLWMQENLKTTRYLDGSAIPNVPDSATWGSLTTGAYCDFHNLPAEGEFYGRLYNFYAVDDSRKMCPAGWHVPSHGEWNHLEKFLDSTVDTNALGGTGRIIGRILKEGCNTRWAYMDSTYGLNSVGFTALCANFRNASGAWSLAPDNNHDDAFWTSTTYNATSAWYRSLRWCFSDIYSLFPMKRAGQSVRCIRDN